MGLLPLEFSDCLTDSPYFRQKLQTHEKELEKTSKGIKGLINECKDLLNAAKQLSKAQRTFAKTLVDFKFECIGSEQTDDEAGIADSLKEFGKLISSIEDERDRMLEQAFDQIIRPLEAFRKEQIGEAKNGKKKFDKQTAKFCQSLERYLNLKSKTNEGQLQEADAAVEMEQRHFYQASMQYVILLQEVQERKKFEFVETLLSFIYSWLTFYHVGHEVYGEFEPYMTGLQQKLQKCRGNFNLAKTEAETLMYKMLEVRGTKTHEQNAMTKTCTREGYLFLMEKKALGTTWTKFYCQYQKENKILTMISYSQVTGKGITGLVTDTMVMTTCTKRAADSIEKRFCFDIEVMDRPGSLTLQALSEEDRNLWMNAMDGKEPAPSNLTNSHEFDTLLDDVGFNFIKKCITSIEKRGLDEQGLYRVVGVNSKVNKLTNMGLDRRKLDKLDMDDAMEVELKTITSALKNYFRSLPEPLMTFKLHDKFIAAAKREVKTLRINDIHELVHKLPEPNFEMLDMLVLHLTRVAAQNDKNLMSISNLGVCFGPTLMRSAEESMAAIMNIKFCNIVVEILIGSYHKIFKTAPDGASISDSRVLDTAAPVPSRPPTQPSQPQQVIRPPTSSPRPAATTTPVSPAFPAMMTSSYPGPTTGYDDSAQTYAQYRARWKPTGGFYSQYSPGGDQTSSASSSTESLNSKGSAHNNSASSINAASQPADSSRKQTTPSINNSGVAKAIHRFSQPVLTPTGQSGRQERTGRLWKRKSVDSAMSASASSLSNLSASLALKGRTVRTLYACEAENDSELSFEPNQIIHNVRLSREPGWLEGTLGGKSGLVPSNYVEYLD